MNDGIYLDHAATTEMLPEVVAAMEPYFIENYGNASALYEIGMDAKQAIEEARKQVATVIGVQAKEIYFTSGGSESDNWAIKGIAGENKNKGRHIVTSKIEHHAVLHSCEYLEKLGYKVSYLDVNSEGIVDWNQLQQIVEEGEKSVDQRNRVTLISVMYGNNEIGTIEPIEEIGKYARKHKIIFHTDAVQVVGQIPIHVGSLPIDLLSASAHKFHGPKGVGFLYVRDSVSIPSFIDGGAQESGKRAGTENVAGIVGMAKALTMAAEKMRQNQRELTALRNYFATRVLREIKDVKYNGHTRRRLPGNVNFSIKNVDATALLVLLEEEGIYASAGSACNSETTTISHVIQAIAVPKEYAYGTIRFSMGRGISRKEVDRTIDILKQKVKILRLAKE